MKVSFVIPVRDGAAYISQAVESLLGQTRPPDEIIVIDDGSTDDGPVLAAHYGPPVIVASQRPLGIAAARNHGIRLAGGDVIGFLDADDVAPPGRLAAQVAALEDDPRLGGVTGLIEEFMTEGEVTPDGVRAPLSTRPARLSGALLVRRSALDEVGPFGEGTGRGEGLDWFVRAQDAGIRIEAIPHLVLRRRLHDANYGISPGGEAEYLAVLKASLDRRRGGG